jgi:hypothetical protein
MWHHLVPRRRKEEEKISRLFRDSSSGSGLRRHLSLVPPKPFLAWIRPEVKETMSVACGQLCGRISIAWHHRDHVVSFGQPRQVPSTRFRLQPWIVHIEFRGSRANASFRHSNCSEFIEPRIFLTGVGALPCHGTAYTPRTNSRHQDLLYAIASPQNCHVRVSY